MGFAPIPFTLIVTAPVFCVAFLNAKHKPSKYVPGAGLSVIAFVFVPVAVPYPGARSYLPRVSIFPSIRLKSSATGTVCPSCPQFVLGFSQLIILHLTVFFSRSTREHVTPHPIQSVVV